MNYLISVILDIFEPLFAVTKDPSIDPKLHAVLLHVSGFDSVDDESKLESKLTFEYVFFFIFFCF